MCAAQHSNNHSNGEFLAESAASDFSGFAKPLEPKRTRPTWPRNIGSCVAGRAARRDIFQEQSSEDTIPYDRSTKFCFRHMRAVSTEAGSSKDGTNKEAAVEAENIKAARQAKTQACLLNTAVARKEVALGMAWRKYRRLEEDMIRSRMELMDTLSDIEKERNEHASELEGAKKHGSALETALRTADEVLRKLTTENKRQRCQAEQHEKSSRARVAKLERRLEQSELELRNEKLSTWRTIRRETERAAGRERYLMTAFLQRYVMENEFLRAAQRETAETASELKERVRELEDQIEKSLAVESGGHQAAQTSPASSPDRTPPGIEETTNSIGSPRTLTELRGRETGFQPPPLVCCEQGVDGRGFVPSTVFPDQGHDDAAHSTTPTEAEMAAQRLKNRIEGSLVANSGCAKERPGPGTRGGGLPVRMTERRGVTFAMGRVVELSSLLAETESERDTLAALLILAEKRMERMTLAQEELALKLAWDSVLTSRQREKKQQHQQHQDSKLIPENSGENLAVDCKSVKSLGIAKKNQTLATADSSAPRSTSMIVDRDAAVDESCAAAVENVELRRRVDHLEMLNRATDAGAREIAAENLRLASSWWRSSSSTTSFSLRGGVAPTSVDAKRQALWSYRGDRDPRSPSLTCVDGGKSCEVGSDEDNNDSFGADGIASPLAPSPSPSPSTPFKGSGGVQARMGRAASFPVVGQPSGHDADRHAEDQGRPQSWPSGGGSGRQQFSSTLRQCSEKSAQPEQHLELIGNNSGFMRAQLAWVLGFPAATTSEHELLAEVMHLAVKRGLARTDASVLEAQLAVMDAQSLSLARLATATVPLQNARSTHRAADAFAHSSVFTLGEGTLVSSLSLDQCNSKVNPTARTRHRQRNRGDGGVGCSETERGRRVPDGGRVGTTRRQKLSRNANSDSTRATGGSVLPSHHAGAGGSSDLKPNHAESPLGANCKDMEDHQSDQQAPGPTAPTAPMLLEMSRSRDSPADALTDVAAEIVASPTTGYHDGRLISSPKGDQGTGPNMAGTVATEGSGGGDGGGIDGHISKNTFARMLKGRLVPIDVFCTKIQHGASSDSIKRLETAGDLAPLGTPQADEEKYKVRIEAYDPVLLRRHVLDVHEEDIRRCFSSHPDLYTLGANRRRVQEALTDHLIFMAEDAVEASLNRQSRVDGEEVIEGSNKSSVAGVPGPGSEPDQLLVLMGDAEDIILTENKLDLEGEDADVDRAEAVEGGRKRAHRFAHSALLQIEKEEEIVEGVTFKYEPPLAHDESDPEAERLARALATMDSEPSFQEEDGDGGDEKEEDDDQGKKDADEVGKDNYEGEKDVDEGEKDVDEGEKGADEGEKNADEGEKVDDEGEKADDEGEKAADEGEKADDEGEKADEQDIVLTEKKYDLEGEDADVDRAEALEDGRNRAHRFAYSALLQLETKVTRGRDI